MTAVNLCYPRDELVGPNINHDLAADYLELTAFFAPDSTAACSDLMNAAEIGADDEYGNVGAEMEEREEVVAGAVYRIEGRIRVLDKAYPFALDDHGNSLALVGNPTPGHAAYLLCLVLSNLKGISPILNDLPWYPSDAGVRQLRQFFQYFATAALAAEVGGRAWSFGWPRPDRSTFPEKLHTIWEHVRDGVPKPGGTTGAPANPKDDRIDIFAARLHRDRLPGFLFAAAQVATGANWRDKSIKDHVRSVFKQRWFSEQPATETICYHIVPFARPDREFVDDTRELGNILHRTRLPFRVAEAAKLVKDGLEIEAFDECARATDWLTRFRQCPAEPAG